MNLLILVLLLCVSGTAFSQSSARFTIVRCVVAGGGMTVSSSGRFQLAGTCGQAEAAVPASSRFSIQGGFWIRPAPILFAPPPANGKSLISIQTELGGNYTVSYATSISGSTWQTLTNFTGNGSVMTVTNSTLSVTSRFYRLIQQ